VLLDRTTRSVSQILWSHALDQRLWSVHLGLNALLATASTDQVTPVIAA
jgi:hypothetical protein